MGINSVSGSSIPNSATLGPVSVNVDPAFLNNPIVQDIVKILENVSTSVFAGAPAGQTGPFGKTLDVNIEGVKVSLPNPLYKLDAALGPLGTKVTNLSEFLRKVGQFLTSGTRDLGNGVSVNVPGLNQRLGAITSADNGLASALGSAGATGVEGVLSNLFGGGDATADASGSGGLANLPSFGSTATGDATAFPASTAGDTYGGIGSAGEVSMTADESAAYAKMTPAEQAQYMLQKKMEAHSRMVALMTNLMKMMHDTLMGVIQNIKS